MNKKDKNSGRKRNIDLIIESSTQNLGTTLSLMSRTEIKFWKAVLVMFFVGGFFTTLIIGSQIKQFYPVAKAQNNVYIYTLTEDEAHKDGDSFQTEILLNCDSKNIVAVQAIASYDPDQVSVSSVDTSSSDFPYEVLNEIDTDNDQIMIASAKPTPGVNASKAKIAVVNLKAKKDFQGSGISLVFSSTNAVEDSAAILDDGQGTNILSAITENFTNPVNIPSKGTTPVYRFFNRINGEHFFTIDPDEKNTIVSKLFNVWTYEGIAFYVYPRETSSASPLFRFFNKRTGEHFFSVDPAERDAIISKLSDTWKYEGIAFYVYWHSNKTAESTSVYRFFNKKTGEHFFTIDPNEKKTIVDKLSNTWEYEGVAFYVYPKQM